MDRHRTSRRAAFWASAALLFVAACKKPLDPEKKTLARERAAALLQQDQYSLARAALAPLLLEKEVEAGDWLRAAVVEYADGAYDAFEAHLARARELAPREPQLLYLAGQSLKEQGKFAEARANFEAVLAARPDDLPNRLALGEACDELGDIASAEAQYRAVVAVGIENGGLWYCSAIYRLARLLTLDGREDLAKPLNERWSELEKLGVKLPQPLAMMLGTLARPAPPTPAGTRIEPRATTPGWSLREVRLPEFAGALELRALDLDGDNWTDLLARKPDGCAVAYGRNDGTFESLGLVAGIEGAPLERVVAFDVDNDADLDLLLQSGARFVLQRQDAMRAFAPSPLAFPGLSAPPSDVVAVDHDHEGDLDLVLVGPFGARVWRNDGAAEPEKGGAYTDATEGSGLPTGEDLAWCVAEDIDGDNDVDFLFGGPRVVWVADSLRAGKFRRVEAPWDGFAGAERAPLVADLDGDARPDVVLSGAENSFLPQRGSRRALKSASGAAWRAEDWDNSGALDLLWRQDANGQLAGLLDAGTAAERAWKGSLPLVAPLWTSGDLDGDAGLDLVSLQGPDLSVWRNDGPRGKAVRLSYRGARDNRRAVGAVLEYRARGVYRRIYWRGEPQLAGVGDSERIDVLRLTWPNGVVSTQLDLPLQPTAGVDDFEAALDGMIQPSGQIGSCPFLYTWNGRAFEFISDVLGITPLGLPIAPGMHVPPDHDEYVLVKGEQLVPDEEGRLVLQFTEELREVTYLDHAKLLAVDHPADSEIFPNEMFCFPPFPV
ncbi:MAG: FG-GAP-like repeat-containing protein, partial [Planctomycetia bacterium]